MKGVLKVSKEQVIEIELYCLQVTVPKHNRHSGKRTIDYSNLDVVENVIDSQEVLDAPEYYVLVGEETTDTLVIIRETGWWM